MNEAGEMEHPHGKQGKALVFREDMWKIAPDKIGRALILLAIGDVTAKRGQAFKGIMP
jgi:hypothetical protein